jgi:hypothetical protein
MLQRQHPHRAGRIRRDKQFGSSLYVVGGEEEPAQEQNSAYDFLNSDDDDDDLLGFVAFKSK